jgi:hypothetical protein
MISDALSISIYSDSLMAMKAEALLLVCILWKFILLALVVASFHLQLLLVVICGLTVSFA